MRVPSCESQATWKHAIRYVAAFNSQLESRNSQLYRLPSRT
ncbi:hypothetical protein PLANPX_1419 [Lacipirellula parvula]|uniref:Uncharacterized protein n=1 Tax=Lacipirellula parvula TaxID=2650471 RepID=A0A5K7X7H8_9BACT|nr:hypothetical protein PLANPX_1419 [Lacipirellula parvula]